MNHSLKKFLKALWSLTDWIRRPLKRKLQGVILDALSPLHVNFQSMTEHDLVLDSLVRELVRLQDKVEMLQQTLQELAQDQKSPAPETSPRRLAS